MTPIPPAGGGEVLKLGPPSPGEITITVDPRRTGSAFSMGKETLLPGSEIPLHRHLGQDEVLFVHKGQGRAVLEGRAMPLVPGMMLYVPRQAWHSLRNTGTGLLQITWTSAPPGIEEFFRELSRLGASANAAAIQEAARRHGIEFPTAGQPLVAGAPAGGPGRRRRHHRGGRGRGRGGQPSPRQPVQARPPLGPATVVAAAHREPAGGRGSQGGPRSGPAGVSVAPATPPSATRSSPGSRHPRRPPPRSRGRVKEVYMGGRWVRVVGEGPVIAPGHEQPERQGPTRKGRDEPR